MTTETTPSTQGPLTGRLVTLLSIATGVIVANLYYLQPLLHQMSRDFHVGAASASLLITSMQVGYMAGLAFVVPLGDLIPRRRLLVGIFLLSALTMGIGAVLTSFAALALVTLVIGLSSVGGQVIIPFAADLALPGQRGRTIAHVTSGLLLGILLSRTVSGLIAQVAGWRSVYWGAAALLVVVALVLHRVLPTEPARPRVTYRTLVVGSLSLLVTERELRRRAWLGALAFGGFSAMWTTLSFHLSRAPFHYSNGVIGLFGLFGVAGVAAANVAGHHADRQRTRRSTIVSATIYVLGFAVLWFGRHSPGALAVGIMALDAGVQGIQISNQSIIYTLVPEARSRINSAYMVCFFAGASLGSYAAGQLYGSFSWGGVCALGGAIGLALLMTALWSPRRATV